MLNHIKIRDLELVIALHEEHNVTQAAKRVNISEPAFSKRLQLIERHVQAKLFTRGHDGTLVTPSGLSFVEGAQTSLQAFYQGIHDAQEAKYSEHHKLNIGVSAFLSPHLIDLLHSTELRLYRNLSLEIVTECSIEILSRLQHHQIDLALITSPPPSASITSAPVAIEPFMIVVRPNHPLAMNKVVTFGEVMRYPWVFINRNVHPPLHDLILQRAQAEQQPANIVHHVSQADQVGALLTNNSLVAWLTPAGAERVVRGGFIGVPLRDEQIRLETRLVTLANNKSRLISEFVRMFMKRIEEERPPTQLQLRWKSE
jgi:DNA-binding transcriptional LysR family regulator